MDAAKITLSEEEMQLVVNAEWILTKNAILHKVVQLLGAVQEQISAMPQMALIPGELTRISPKISQGENYLGLPYRILDFPRVFSKEDCFAIRCFFWWGNFFSVTLHLKGDYLERYKQTLLFKFNELAAADFYLSNGTDEWQHHFESDNFISLQEINEERFETMLTAAKFLKIACQLPLSQWSEASDWMIRKYKLIIEMISSQGDGTDL